MGRIITSVTVSNTNDASQSIRFDALVDTGATYLTLPDVWQDRLGDLEKIEDVDFQAANGEIGTGAIYGAVKIQVENFRPVFGEVRFTEMESDEFGNYKPLVGYIALNQIPVAVDLLNNRLVKINAIVK